MAKWHTVRCCINIILAILLASCGSSHNSSVPASSSAAAKTISGVAAAGAPISGKVFLRDASGKNLSVPIAPDGSFSFDATGLAMPCVLLSSGTVGMSYSELYSLAQAPGTANINPLSNLAFTLVSAGDPDRLAAADPAKLIEAASSFRGTVAQLRDALKGTLSLFGAADGDFVTDKYNANHQGLDLMFDLIEIHYLGTGPFAEIEFVEKTTGRSAHARLDTLLSQWIPTLRPMTPPLTAGNVCVFPMDPTVPPNGKVALSAVVIGSREQRVSWRVAGTDSGSISSDGVYTAPAKVGFYSVTASTPSRQTTIQIQVVAPSLSPDPFTFADKTATLADVGGDVLSDPVTITGEPNSSWKLSLTSNSSPPAGVLIDSVYYVPELGLPDIHPGQRLIVVQSPSPVLGGTTVTTVKVGDYSTTFTCRTVQSTQ